MADRAQGADRRGGAVVAEADADEQARDVSNARTEGFNRVIKQTKRVACGCQSMTNYHRRILSHIAVTRPHDQRHERDQPRSNSKSHDARRAFGIAAPPLTFAPLARLNDPRYCQDA
jgi:hypothetical protein